jgi:hypothetical protein
MTQTAKLELQLVGGSKLTTDVERTFDFIWTVQAVDPNGTATVAIDVTALSLHLSGPGGQEADYDSASEDEPHGFAASLAPLFQALLKAQLIAKLTPRGDLVALEVPEELQTVLRSKPAGKAVGQLGTVSDLESLATLGLPPMPASADTAQGSEWTDQRTVQDAALGPIVAETTYRWESTAEENGDKIARIIPATTFGFPPPAEGKPSLSSTEALTSGEILFNLTQGHVQSVAYNDAMDISTHGAGEPTVGTLHHTLTISRP